MVGFKQKQWLSEEIFRNIIHNQTYNWTKYALCESTVSDGLQSEGMVFGRSFSKHYTHSNIQLNKVCGLWKSSEWWASSRSKGFQKKFFKTLFSFKCTIEHIMRSLKVHLVTERWPSSRSNGFQSKFFETLYTFKHTIEQIMLSVKVQWLLGFKQKQWLWEVVFWNIIHIQTYNWTKYAVCESPVSGGIQAEAMAFGRSFSKQYSHSNI